MAQATDRSLGSHDLTSSVYWDRKWTGRRQGLVRNFFKRRTQNSNDRAQPLYDLIAWHIDDSDRRPAKVLEIGCAPGTILEKIQRLRPDNDFSGVDYAEQGLTEAQQRFVTQDINARLHLADLRQFEPAEKYNLVFSCGLLEHFTDPGSIIQHHARLGMAGGRVLITVPDYSSALQQWFMQQLDPESLREHNLTIMQPKALESLMCSAGLLEVEVGCIGIGSIRAKRRSPGLRTFLLRIAAFAGNELLHRAPTNWGWPLVIWASGRIPENGDQSTTMATS